MTEVTSLLRLIMKLCYTKDVMSVMAALRNDWGLVYPEEE